MKLEADKPIRAGVRELRYGCTECGYGFKTFNPLGHVMWWAMLATINVGIVWGFATDRVKYGEGPDWVIVVLLLDAVLGFVGGRAALASRRNPPVA